MQSSLWSCWGRRRCQNLHGNMSLPKSTTACPLPSPLLRLADTEGRKIFPFIEQIEFDWFFPPASRLEFHVCFQYCAKNICKKHTAALIWDFRTVVLPGFAWCNSGSLKKTRHIDVTRTVCVGYVWYWRLGRGRYIRSKHVFFVLFGNKLNLQKVWTLIGSVNWACCAGVGWSRDGFGIWRSVLYHAFSFPCLSPPPPTQLCSAYSEELVLAPSRQLIHRNSSD